MPLGRVLYESGATLSHVHFPTTAIVSLVYVMQNGESAEIAVVGCECYGVGRWACERSARHSPGSTGLLK